MNNFSFNSDFSSQSVVNETSPLRLYNVIMGEGVAPQLHRHRDMEFVLVLSGNLNITTVSGDHHLSEGQAAMINSDCLHSFCGNGDSRCVYFMFSDEFIAPSGSEISLKYINPIIVNPELSCIVFDESLEWHTQVIEAIRSIVQIMSCSSVTPGVFPLSAAAMSSCLELDVHILICRIWSMIYSGLESIVKSSVNGNEFVSRRRTQMMIDYIRSNYRGSVSLADIAAAANISKSEASRCFQSCLHISPVSYLLKWRVEVAQQLLLNSAMSIETIGFECGFSSASYFCKMFQRHTGMTPGQYRNSSTEDST